LLITHSCEDELTRKSWVTQETRLKRIAEVQLAQDFIG
jgi:hypothetical protein